jgi:hypothetical protein
MEQQPFHRKFAMEQQPFHRKFAMEQQPFHRKLVNNKTGVTTVKRIFLRHCSIST